MISFRKTQALPDEAIIDKVAGDVAAAPTASDAAKARSRAADTDGKARRKRQTAEDNRLL